jgi:hypothetical protein
MSDHPSDQPYDQLEAEYFPYMVRVLSQMGFREIPGWDQDDLQQELRIVLWRAQQNFNPTLMPKAAVGQFKPAVFKTYLRSAIWNRMNKIRYRELFALRRGAVLTGERRTTGKEKPDKEARYALSLDTIEVQVGAVMRDIADVDLFVDMPEQPKRVAEYVLRCGRFQRGPVLRDLGLTPEELDDSLRILQDRLVG